MTNFSPGLFATATERWSISPKEITKDCYSMNAVTVLFCIYTNFRLVLCYIKYIVSKGRLRRFPKGDRKALWSRPQAQNLRLRQSNRFKREQYKTWIISIVCQQMLWMTVAGRFLITSHKRSITFSYAWKASFMKLRLRISF